MDENNSFVFAVRDANRDWEIEDSEDLEDFLEELASLPFFPPQNEGIIQAGAGDMYVFSTACDTGLHGFLLACHPRPVSLFITQPESAIKKTRQKGKKPSKPEHETLYKRAFPASGCAPLPRWLLKTKIRPLNVEAARVEKIYTETKL
jgi:hypothetical protein